jgi:hypothetical protein
VAAGMRATVALAERANTAGATRTTTDGSRRTVAAGSKERARARAVGVNPLTHRHGAENHHGHSCKGGLETTAEQCAAIDSAREMLDGTGSPRFKIDHACTSEGRRDGAE